MDKKVIKIRIEKLEYDKNNNLFQMHIQELETEKKTVLAVKGEDWGITPEKITDEIIEEFCKDMQGQEKNLHIEKDETSITHKKGDEKLSKEELKEINDNIDKYPIREVMNTLPPEGNNES